MYLCTHYSCCYEQSRYIPVYDAATELGSSNLCSGHLCREHLVEGCHVPHAALYPLHPIAHCQQLLL